MTAAHRIRRWLAAPFARRPFVLQRLRWPNPLRPPYLAREIALYRPGELGDVVMSLAVVRAIRERNPSVRITFITKYHDLLAGHPLIDRVMSVDEALRTPPGNVVSLRYEVFVPLRLHVIDYLAGCVGLRDIAHDIPLPDYTSELGELHSLLGERRPRIVVTRNAGPFTPNKEWPNERWDALIRRLAVDAVVVELGTSAAEPPLAASHLDLRGRTNLRQFCGLISLADLVICPLTSAVHIAAAYKVPTVSVLGGYELPENTAYPRHVPLYRNVPCSPCWRQDACPYDRECLQRISVDQVLAAAQEQLRR